MKKIYEMEGCEFNNIDVEMMQAVGDAHIENGISKSYEIRDNKLILKDLTVLADEYVDFRKLKKFNVQEILFKGYCLFFYKGGYYLATYEHYQYDAEQFAITFLKFDEQY